MGGDVASERAIDGAAGDTTTADHAICDERRPRRHQRTTPPLLRLLRQLRIRKALARSPHVPEPARPLQPARELCGPGAAVQHLETVPHVRRQLTRGVRSGQQMWQGGH